MHILYVQQILVLPGARGNDRSWTFAKMWTEAGHKVSFLSSTAGFTKEKTAGFKKLGDNHFSFEGIEIYTIPVDYDHQMSFPKRIKSFLQFFWKALSIGKKIKNIDLVLGYTAPLSVAELSRRLATYHQKPFFLEVADPWPEVPIEMGVIKWRFLQSFLLKRTKKIYHSTEHIFAFSDGIKESILKHDMPDDKVSVIYNGADFQQFAPVLHGNKDSVKIVYTGTIGIANDLTQVVRAAKILETSGEKNIEFIIIGDGNDLKRVKAFAEKEKVESVHFHPKVEREELSVILQNADIGISSFANFKILETNSATKFYDYLAMGLPIVLNYQGWQAEYLGQFQCGLSSPQGDIESFAANIKSLAQNPLKRKEWGGNGRKLALEKFDRKKMAGQELAILEAIKPDRP